MKALKLALLIIISNSAFSEDESYLNGISINSNLSDVIEIFGEPLKTEDAWDWFDYVHSFEGFELYAHNDGVIVGGASETDGICLGLNVCVGGELASNQFTEAPSYKSDRYSHVLDKRWCPYFVNVVNEVVVKVAVLCRPD